MARSFLQTAITDLDDINTTGSFTGGTGVYSSSEIEVDAANKLFWFKGAGNLANAGTGVTGQALYSFFKSIWKNNAGITAYDFPMLSITNEQFEFIDGWRPDDTQNVTQTLTVTGNSNIDFNNTDSTISHTGDLDFRLFQNGDTITVTGATTGGNNTTYTVSGTPTKTTITTTVAPVATESGQSASIAADIVYKTRQLIRTAGWAEVDTDSNVSRRYSGVVSLGTFVDDADQAYYAQDASFTANTKATGFDGTTGRYTGPVNEAVQIYGNIATANADTDADTFVSNITPTTTAITSVTVASRTVVSTGHGLAVGDVVELSGTTDNDGFYTVESVTDANTVVLETISGTDGGAAGTIGAVGYDLKGYYKLFLRERGKTYAASALTDIGVSTMTTIVYRFPLTNATDLNINTTDDGAFTGVTVSAASGTGSVVTITTAAPHGLYVDSPVTISGSSNGDINGTFTVTEIVSATQFRYNGTNTANATDGTVKIGYFDIIDLTYLTNPDTSTGNVRIRGAFSQGTSYNAGDVVFDTGNSTSDANGARWYYVDGTPANAGVNASIQADNTANAGTWSLWTNVDNNGQRDIEETDTWSAYTAVIDANLGGSGNSSTTATKEVIYEWAQYQLRQSSTIDTGTSRNGNVADTLVFFIGSELNTNSISTNEIGGISFPFAVVVDDINSADVNNIQYVDYAGTAHVAPRIVQVTINFNDNLAADGDAVFYAYYDNSFNTTGATQVVQVTPAGNVGTDVQAGMDGANDVPSGGTYTFNYAYDSDATDARTPGQPANITVVAIGLNTGQYVSASGQITAAGGTFSLVAPFERNYVNP